MKHSQHASDLSRIHASEDPSLAGLWSITNGLTKRFTALGAIAAITHVAVLSSWVFSNQAASGFPFRSRPEPTDDQFEACTATLLALGIGVPVAIDACGAAAKPEALSSCIADISENTLIPATNALAGCVRVRRPEAMATCVVALDETFVGALSSEILGYCSRSLLPTVFKNCVQGVTSEDITEAIVTEANGTEVIVTETVVIEPSETEAPETEIVVVETVAIDAMLIMDACVEADYDAPQVFLPTFRPSRARR
ncbi:MAG: hypothetical protein AB4042_20615 [Leptolyngbyaceae cyanobacterium]